MELRVLNYFLMVAREENITKAAQLLHVSQPSLSRQLMKLEEELGVKLFKRSNHHINLTDEGMLLKRRAHELVSLAEKTRKEFHRDGDKLSGEISLGSGEFHSIACIAELIHSFRKEYPLVHFDLFSGDSNGIKDRIENGILDLGLLIDPVEIGKYEFVRFPVKEKWGVLTQKDTELASKEVVGPEDFYHIPVIMPKRSLVQNELSNWFGEYYDHLDSVATYTLLNNAAALVHQGVGSALCLQLDVTYNNLCFIPLSPNLSAATVLVWKRNQMFSPAATAFIDHVKKKCSK